MGMRVWKAGCRGGLTGPWARRGWLVTSRGSRQLLPGSVNKDHVPDRVGHNLLLPMRTNGRQWWVTQVEPRFCKEAMGEAGPECQRFGVGVHAATFWGVAPATALCADAGSVCGERRVVSALGRG